MKVALDLQVCQSQDFRGIGRYSLDFAKAVVKECAARELDLNAIVSGQHRDRLGVIQRDLGIPQSHYRFVHSARNMPSDVARGEIDSLFMNRLSALGQYDVVHDSHAFEYPEKFALNFHPEQAKCVHSAIFYDLIPLKLPEKYLADDAVRESYMRQVGALKRRDVLFAISEATRRDGLDLLRLPPDRIVTISTGVDEDLFHQEEVTPLRCQELRERFGISKPFLMYTTGLDPRKNLLRLVRAFSELPKALRDAHQLVIVCPRNAWSEEIIAGICRDAGVEDGREVIFTGFVSDGDLVDLYRMSRLFVFPSLYEGFGLPIVEAVRCGAPAIGSDCSSIVELLPDPATRFDPISVEAISRCIVDTIGRGDGGLRTLQRDEYTHMAQYTWKNVACTALDAWEEFVRRKARQHPIFHLRSFVPADPRRFNRLLVKTSKMCRAGNGVALARLCVLNGKCHDSKPRILYDISWWINANITTGIQRVVSKVATAFRERQDGFEYQAVALKGGRLLNCRYDESLGKYVYDETWSCRERDILIMLDSSWEWRESFLPYFDQIHAFGGSVYSVVYDILPVLKPELFDVGIKTIFPLWLNHALKHTDGLACISRSVGAECRDYAMMHRGALPVGKQMPIGHFYLGADFASCKTNSTDVPFSSDMRVIISVGTIEPRKNHAYMLDVMERVLACNPSVCWVIVGQKGWMMDAWTNNVLLKHPMFGRQILYYPKADDAQLSALYDRAEFLLNLSKGEGYGLPLIEAGEKGKCVICSDIPVFHEIDRFGFAYCPLDDAEKAVGVVLDALSSAVHSCRGCSGSSSKFSWSDAAQMLVDCVVNNHWDFVVSVDKAIPREKEKRISGSGLLLQEYRFSEPCDAAYSLVNGFSPRETWGVWCEGQRSELTIKLPETEGGLLLIVKAQCFGDKCKNVRISNGEDELAVWDVAGSAPSEYVLDCASLPREREVDLVLEPSATVRPCDVIPGNQDTRKLSMGLISMTLKCL